MTTKTTTEQPVALTENATNKVQGGAIHPMSDLLASSVKAGPKLPDPERWDPGEYSPSSN